MVFKRKKLFARLLFLTLASALLPLLVTALILTPRFSPFKRQWAGERLFSESLTLAHYLETELLTPLQYCLNLGDKSGQFLRKDTSNNFLSQFGEIQRYIVYFHYYPSDYTLVNDKENTASIVDTGFVELPPGPFHVGVVIDSTGQQFLRVDLIKEQTHILTCVINLHSFFQNLMKNQLLRATTSPLLILDKEQQLVVFSTRLEEPVSHEKLNRYLEENPDTTADQFGIRIEKFGSLAVGTDLNTLVNWRILALSPKVTLNHDTNKLWWSFLGIFLFALVLASWVTFHYWQRIAGPLERFARTATEVARGNFDQKIEPASDDEIGRLARIFNYMVIELRRLQNMNLNQIIAERTKTKTIIKNIADGIIVTDSDDRIVTINMAAAKWFKLSESDVVDRQLSEVLHLPELLEIFQEIRESRRSGTFAREVRVRLPREAKDRYFQIHASKMFDQNEEFVGIVAVLRDITREKEIDQMKTELVSMVAHQLRSPLTSIYGFAELMMNPDEDKNSLMEYAAVIKEESGRLSNMVNKFLDISRMEAGRMDFHPEVIGLREVLDPILYIVSPEAQKKNIRVDVHIQKPDMEIFADSKMISEVILNLLTNAIKYSPENTTVKLTASESSLFSIVQVADQGYGISPKHLSQIFKKFYRVKDDPRIQEERGTGLGLSLVKEIVDLHKGEIKVESEIGKGTVFTIKLPGRGQYSWNP